MLSWKVIKKNWQRLFNYRLSRRQRLEAEQAAVAVMLDTLIALQVKTTYGLTYEGVSKMLAKQSGNMSHAADSQEIGRAERAAFLHISAVLLEKAKQLKLEGAKSAGKDEP